MPSLLAQNEVPGDAIARKRTGSNRSAEPLLVKRRKTTGLNSRFDRMIETVNILHTSPASSKSSHSGRRRRAASSSSASADFDVPRTPVDAYSELHEGRLGADFAVIKMHGDDSTRDMGVVESSGDYRISNRRSRKPPSIPAWLGNTLSTLDVHHPLRMLLPSSSSDVSARLGTPIARSDSNDIPAPLDRAMSVEPPINEDSIFAFNPLGDNSTTHTVRPNARNLSLPGHPASNFSAAQNPFSSDAYVFPQLETSTHLSSISGESLESEDPLPMPFSTPGPASSVGAVPPADLRLGSVGLSREDAVRNIALEASDRLEGTELPGAGLAPFAQPGPRMDASASQHNPMDVLDHSDYSDSLSYLAQHAEIMDTAVAGSPDSRLATGWLRSAATRLDSILDSETTPGSSSSFPLDMTITLPALRPLSNVADTSLLRPRCDKVRSTGGQVTASKSPQMPIGHAPERVRNASPRPVRIYFDSPAEDPCSSDPLDENDYMLPADLAFVDFKWERFDRGSIGESHASGSSSSDIWAGSVDLPGASSPFGPVARSILRTPVLEEGNVRFSSSARSPALHEEERLEDTDGTWIVPSLSLTHANTSHAGDGHRTACVGERKLEEPTHLPVFAPAPGIFISPLKAEGDGRVSILAEVCALYSRLGNEKQETTAATVVPHLVDELEASLRLMGERLRVLLLLRALRT
ncbi:hypothetical protein EVJ58_g3413 [Rhodofomes roseus]|uniref:Uncharacterized protein n=1 Tax=Rhodofomes roseus TaxID=34475 RepID=A0A4Y9YND7_9APHY|nr:hypothetical protein EVJ58_g3413 [Rhodofomes roseus]